MSTAKLVRPLSTMALNRWSIKIKHQWILVSSIQTSKYARSRSSTTIVILIPCIRNLIAGLNINRWDYLRVIRTFVPIFVTAMFNITLTANIKSLRTFTNWWEHRALTHHTILILCTPILKAYIVAHHHKEKIQDYCLSEYTCPHMVLIWIVSGHHNTHSHFLGSNYYNYNKSLVNKVLHFHKYNG